MFRIYFLLSILISTFVHAGQFDDASETKLQTAQTKYHAYLQNKNIDDLDAAYQYAKKIANEIQQLDDFELFFQKYDSTIFILLSHIQYAKAKATPQESPTILKSAFEFLNKLIDTYTSLEVYSLQILLPLQCEVINIGGEYVVACQGKMAPDAEIIKSAISHYESYARNCDVCAKQQATETLYHAAHLYYTLGKAPIFRDYIVRAAYVIADAVKALNQPTRAYLAASIDKEVSLPCQIIALARTIFDLVVCVEMGPYQEGCITSLKEITDYVNTITTFPDWQQVSARTLCDTMSLNLLMDQFDENFGYVEKAYQIAAMVTQSSCALTPLENAEIARTYTEMWECKVKQGAPRNDKAIMPLLTEFEKFFGIAVRWLMNEMDGTKTTYAKYRQTHFGESAIQVVQDAIQAVLELSKISKTERRVQLLTRAKEYAAFVKKCVPDEKNNELWNNIRKDEMAEMSASPVVLAKLDREVLARRAEKFYGYFQGDKSDDYALLEAAKAYAAASCKPGKKNDAFTLKAAECNYVLWQLYEQAQPREAMRHLCVACEFFKDYGSRDKNFQQATVENIAMASRAFMEIASSENSETIKYFEKSIRLFELIDNKKSTYKTLWKALLPSMCYAYARLAYILPTTEKDEVRRKDLVSATCKMLKQVEVEKITTVTPQHADCYFYLWKYTGGTDIEMLQKAVAYYDLEIENLPHAPNMPLAVSPLHSNLFTMKKGDILANAAIAHLEFAKTFDDVHLQLRYDHLQRSADLFYELVKDRNMDEIGIGVAWLAVHSWQKVVFYTKTSEGIARAIELYNKAASHRAARLIGPKFSLDYSVDQIEVYLKASRKADEKKNLEKAAGLIDSIRITHNRQKDLFDEDKEVFELYRERSAEVYQKLVTLTEDPDEKTRYMELRKIIMEIKGE